MVVMGGGENEAAVRDGEGWACGGYPLVLNKKYQKLSQTFPLTSLLKNGNIRLNIIQLQLEKFKSKQSPRIPNQGSAYDLTLLLPMFSLRSH